MALTLVTNPVGTDSVKIFSGFNPVKFVFKREDLQIIDTESGTGGLKINHTGDLSAYLAAGDTIYLYSVGANYTYNGSFEILTIVAGEITVDTPFIEASTGGYINYFKNYYVELQCINPALPDVNILTFSLKSDGDNAGNINIDVSIANDLNRQRGEIASGLISESSTEFGVKYKQVYTGSSESFTIVANKLIVLSYATETPESEVILNSFEMPCLYLGYKSALAMSNIEDPATTLQITYNELDINQNIIASGTLDELDSDVNGFLLWEWAADISINDTTKYIDFDFAVKVFSDFATTDFATPDFLTT